MKLPVLTRNQLSRLALLGLTAQCLSSCALPPREAWQRMKDEGVLHALFAPRRTAPIEPGRLAASQSAPVQFGPVSAASTAAAAEPRIPTAEVFPGHRGFVYSPFTRPKKLVNASGFAPGEHALCPYTLGLFIVPDYGQSVVVARTGNPNVEPQRERIVQSDPEPANPAVVELVSRDPNVPLPPSFPPSPPSGTWVPGRPGHVYSPFAAKHQLVDVSGIASGVEVKCPYTAKLFRVPEPAEVTAPPTVPPLPEPADPAPEKPAVPPAPADPSAPPDPGTAPPSKPPAPTEPSPPTALWADGEPGLVQSPFGEPGQLVDVTGKEAGSTVICPFSNKAFLVPAKK